MTEGTWESCGLDGGKNASGAQGQERTRSAHWRAGGARKNTGRVPREGRRATGSRVVGDGGFRISGLLPDGGSFDEGVAAGSTKSLYAAAPGAKKHQEPRPEGAAKATGRETQAALRT